LSFEVGWSDGWSDDTTKMGVVVGELKVGSNAGIPLAVNTAWVMGQVLAKSLTGRAMLCKVQLRNCTNYRWERVGI